MTPGSPADRAGFCPGDVVIEFGGKPVESIKEVFGTLMDVSMWKLCIFAMRSEKHQNI